MEPFQKLEFLQLISFVQLLKKPKRKKLKRLQLHLNQRQKRKAGYNGFLDNYDELTVDLDTLHCVSNSI